MKITKEIFKSFLLCKYKAYLLLQGESGVKTEYETVLADGAEQYLAKALKKISVIEISCERFRDPQFHGKESSFYRTSLENNGIKTLCITERVRGGSALGSFHYVPVIFSVNEKLAKEDKDILAYDGFVLDSIQARRPDFGRIISGNGFKITKLCISDMVEKAHKVVASIKRLSVSPSRMMLNRHCHICEFSRTCRAKALEKDDLSLLSGMPQKEIEVQNKKGIFTVTQLSYTFRPRRIRKMPENYRRPHSVALRALAIRDRKVYVHGVPVVPQKQVEIFFDVEGREDRVFIYLASLVVVIDGKVEEHSFWANNPEEEVDVLLKCLQVLKQYDDYVLYHYGNYEASYLKRMKKKQGVSSDDIDMILSRAFNLLTVFFDNVYMPTYTNGLKDIAQYLGFHWSDKSASGLQSIVWRTRWEMTGANEYQDKLIRYNMEDCYALLKVKRFIDCMVAKEAKDKKSSDIVLIEDLKKNSMYKFRVGEFALPEFEALNNYAQFDYQRERVHVRTNSYLKKYYTKSISLPKKNLYIYTGKTNVSLPAPKKEPCPLCHKNTRKTSENLSKKIVDLKFSKSGVKRWIVQVNSNLFYCVRCKKTFRPLWYKRVGKMYGHDLMAWTMYQHIVKGQGFRRMVADFKEIFDLDVSYTNTFNFKSYIMDYYQETFENISKKILNSPVLYVDETPINMKDASGYAWVLTNTIETISFYRPTREGDFIKEYLANYNGILVTDFYSAYDALNCLQQKCLLHLIRDFNDDLLKNPFDDEFKGIAKNFTALLQEIVGVIDKRGFKSRHLKKYNKQADQFLKDIFSKEYNSEVAQQYQKRFLKNQDKLFLFLSHDNVAWSNNAVEHAIKLLATHQNKNLAFSRESRMEEYLKIMSIYQTCKYKGISFLKFMLSREKDIDGYCEKFLRKRKIISMLG